MTRELETTAYHEAGHAVACYELERAFQWVSVVPSEESLGRVIMKANPWNLKFDSYAPVTTRVRTFLENDIVISLAGPVAEERFIGVYNGIGASKDWKDAFEAAAYLVGGNPTEAGLYLDWLEYQARHFFDQPFRWIAVQALATELQRSRSVFSREGRRIIREAIKDAMHRRAKEGAWIDHFGQRMPDGQAMEAESVDENGVVTLTLEHAEIIMDAADKVQRYGLSADNASEKIDPVTSRKHLIAATWLRYQAERLRDQCMAGAPPMMALGEDVQMARDLNRELRK